MFRANSVVTIMYSYVLYFFLIFIFLSIFMAIFVSSYELTIKEYGYPQDFMELVKWEYRDYLYWMVEWLPAKLLKKIKKGKAGAGNNLEEDEVEAKASTGKEDTLNEFRTEE